MAGFFDEGGQPPVSLLLQTAGQFTFYWIVIQVSREMATTRHRVQSGEGDVGSSPRRKTAESPSAFSQRLDER
ncbi:hypothetical protein [Xanthomonas sp. NCPPB 1128]|uniref:hypothetical protein n=1 Tax=Xanthomonas sp. NCPPB 1128 TaxID=1775876 RepID=UPI00103D7280|nr:hypothetical protein [Xanthomonas sp. NCPPB 1128]